MSNSNLTKSSNFGNTTFSILDHLDKLTPAKEKGKYICPVCQRHNLSINQKTGEYQCWNGCKCSDIREALSPWAEVVASQSRSDRTLIKTARKQKNLTLAPIPDGRNDIARLPQPVTDCPKAESGTLKGKTGVSFTKYYYSDTEYVLRIKWSDGSRPKCYKKIYIPHFIDDAGKHLEGKGNRNWLLYREREVIQFGAGKWIIWVEGEPCVECYRHLGLVVTTVQGADWQEEHLYKDILRLKKAGIKGIVCHPDHDETGRKKAKQVAAAAARAGLPLVVINPLVLWKDMPEAGDIVDWYQWGISKT